MEGEGVGEKGEMRGRSAEVSREAMGYIGVGG
jgi:hypothetical protein